MKIRNDAKYIYESAISAVLPESSVIKRLDETPINGPITLLAIGKAAWKMANAAKRHYGNQIINGMVITKYGHSEGNIEGIKIYEAGHPVVDAASVFATENALRMCQAIPKEHVLLFLISGGGSALFEKPADGISLDELAALSEQLIRSGASINEINAVRKGLSDVKGGRLLNYLNCRSIFAIILSDVVGDSLTTIASGPIFPEKDTSHLAYEVINKYKISISPAIMEAFNRPSVSKVIPTISAFAGNVKSLCQAAQEAAEKCGYVTHVIDTAVTSEAKGFSRFISQQALRDKSEITEPTVWIYGGETTIVVKGNGFGGRSQAMALTSAIEIAGTSGIVMVSVGSDGTDGPTDAAGGMVDGETVSRMGGVAKAEAYLENDDAYHALAASQDLIITGPTGTNVNDLMFILVNPAD